MLTPSQIAEMAESYCKDIGASKTGQAYAAYIAAFTDAMELMSKEWVPIDGNLVNILSQTPEDRISCLFDNGHICLYNDTWPFSEITHIYILPEPPVLTKDKKI